MEIQTAIEILSYHQEWRLGKRDDMIHEPKKLTEALDILLTEVKKLHKPDVSGSLPLDEVRFRATRFAHQCRLNAVTTNSQTVDLYDKLYGQ